MSIKPKNSLVSRILWSLPLFLGALCIPSYHYFIGFHIEYVFRHIEAFPYLASCVLAGCYVLKYHKSNKNPKLYLYAVLAICIFQHLQLLLINLQYGFFASEFFPLIARVPIMLMAVFILRGMYYFGRPIWITLASVSLLLLTLSAIFIYSDPCCLQYVYGLIRGYIWDLNLLNTDLLYDFDLVSFSVLPVCTIYMFLNREFLTVRVTPEKILNMPPYKALKRLTRQHRQRSITDEEFEELRSSILSQLK